MEHFKASFTNGKYIFDQSFCFSDEFDPVTSVKPQHFCDSTRKILGHTNNFLH